MLAKFYRTWIMMRFFAIASAVVVMTFVMIRANCMTAEMDYRGPGSEMEASERHYKDEDNREASERCGSDRERSEDREKAGDYYDDHSA